MVADEQDRRGLAALRAALWEVLNPGLGSVLAGAGSVAGAPAGAPVGAPAGGRSAWLLSEAVQTGPGSGPGDGSGRGASTADPDEARRIVALVELARAGDAEAFGMLYDHYHVSIYRFV